MRNKMRPISIFKIIVCVLSALLLNGCVVRTIPSGASSDVELTDQARAYIKRQGIVLHPSTNNAEILEVARTDGKITVKRHCTDDGRSILAGLFVFLSLGLLPAPVYSASLEISAPDAEARGGRRTVYYTYLRESFGLTNTIWALLPNAKIVDDQSSASRYEGEKEAFERALVTVINSLSDP
jgi:hypothetical protein